MLLFSTVPHKSFVVTESIGLTGGSSSDFFSGFDPDVDFYPLPVALILLNPSLSVPLSITVSLKVPVSFCVTSVCVSQV